MRQILLTGFAAVAVAAAAIATPASAAPVYGTFIAPEHATGTRTLNVNELEAGGGAGITTLNLSWNIGYNMGMQLWTYSYTMDWTPTGANGISHIIFDLSDNCTSAASNCVIDPKVSTGTNASVDPAAVSYATFSGADASNPGMGGPIQGVKFDMPADPDFKTPFSVTFDSERAPVWGDFYTKAGNVTNSGWYSQNVGIDQHDTSTNILNFVAVPDSVTQPQCPNGAPNWPICSFQETEVPEPMSMAMLGAGLLGLAGVRLRRRRAEG